MPDGELTSVQLSFGWGCGKTHSAMASPPCEMCNGTRQIGPPEFTIACTQCSVHGPQRA